MNISLLLSTGQIKFSENKYTDYFNLLGSLLFKLLSVTFSYILEQTEESLSDIEKEKVVGPWK